MITRENILHIAEKYKKKYGRYWIHKLVMEYNWQVIRMDSSLSNHYNNDVFFIFQRSNIKTTSFRNTWRLKRGWTIVRELIHDALYKHELVKEAYAYYQ